MGVVVLACLGMLGCSGRHDAERPPPSPATAPAPATTAPAPEAPAAPAPEGAAAQPPASQDCAGICYRELPSGGCETMPTCCPRTVRLKAPPHCPAGFTLDMKSGPERCAVNNRCVD